MGELTVACVFQPSSQPPPTRMKPSDSSPTTAPGFPTGNPGRAALPTPVSRVALVLALHALLCSGASAQSATNLNTKPSPPKAAPQKAPAAKTETAAPATKEPAPLGTTPSRFVGEADLDAYVEALSSVFSMRSRATDPFGQLQDPNAKPVPKPTTTTPHPTTRALSTPFADIIRRIEVKMIMPKEKSFLVGTRSIKQGDTIPLTYRGRNIRVAISSVTARRIEFRNLESGETAALNINLLPAGMTPGTRGIGAPGLIPDRPDSPLNLDADDDSNPSSKKP